MNYVKLSNQPEKNFTTKSKNDIIKEKAKSTFPKIESVPTPSSDTIAKVKNKWNSEKKNTLGTPKTSMLQPKSKTSNTEQKPSYSDLQEKIKTTRPYSIPEEKKERERLMDITGAYNLNKVNPSELQKHIRLENKTPDDYHDVNQPYHIAKKRIDEAFGPKTDFSISNFENNFDKMNKEEQAMLTYKMQKEFNKIGYTDFNGEKLKEDGIYGNKTKSVYEKYKKDNKVDYDNVIATKTRVATINQPEFATLKETPQTNEENNLILYSMQNNENGKKVNSNENGQQKYNNDYDFGMNKSITLAKYNGNKNYSVRDKAVLTKEDYEKVKIYQSVYNYAKDILKDDAIADSAHREAVAIRSQDKYSKHEDYGPKRVKIFDSSKGLQYVAVIGYTDNEYEYSDTKDTATIMISRPLSSNDIEWITGSILGTISNANAFTDAHPYWNMFAGIGDWILSKTNPLYNKINPGDVVITVRKHKGTYKEAYEKEYKFYYDPNKEKIYYMK